MVESRFSTNFCFSTTIFRIAFAVDKIFRSFLSSASKLHFSTSLFRASIVYDIQCLWCFMSASSSILSFVLRFFFVEAFFLFFPQEQLHIWRVVHFRATWCAFQPNFKKIKKVNPPTPLLPPPKKNPYISGNRNPKKASYISGNGTFQSTPKKCFIFQETETQKKNLIFPETELSYISGKVYSEP